MSRLPARRCCGPRPRKSTRVWARVINVAVHAYSQFMSGTNSHTARSYVRRRPGTMFLLNRPARRGEHPLTLLLMGSSSPDLLVPGTDRLKDSKLLPEETTTLRGKSETGTQAKSHPPDGPLDAPLLRAVPTNCQAAISNVNLVRTCRRACPRALCVSMSTCAHALYS